jgi:predicted dehydrogenase
MTSHYGVGFRIQRAETHAEDLSFYMDLTTGDRHFERYIAEIGDMPMEWSGRRCPEPLDLRTAGGPDYNETRHFVDCILEDSTPWTNLDDAVETMKLCEAIRSGWKGPLS